MWYYYLEPLGSSSSCGSLAQPLPHPAASQILRTLGWCPYQGILQAGGGSEQDKLAHSGGPKIQAAVFQGKKVSKDRIRNGRRKFLK